MLMMKLNCLSQALHYKRVLLYQVTQIIQLLTFICCFGNGNNAGDIWGQFGEEWYFDSLSHPATNVSNQFRVLFKTFKFEKI